MNSSNDTHNGYLPADGGCTVLALNTLLTPEGRVLLAAMCGELLNTHRDPSISFIERWRRQFAPEVVNTALVVAKSTLAARGKHGKFPQQPNEDSIFWAVPEALEQATSIHVAAYKAAKLMELLPGTQRVFDICGGIGGDALALARFAPVEAWEISPVRAWMARQNTRLPGLHSVTVREEDILNAKIVPAAQCAFHLDPARRSATRRSFNTPQMHPDPWQVMQAFAFCNGGMIKLSPAIDFSSLPSGHLEIISEPGTVVQALLWVGGPAQTLGVARRTATLVRSSEKAWSFTSLPAAPTELTVPDGWMYEVDGSLSRSGLAAPFLLEMGLKPVTVDGGYATGPKLSPHIAMRAFQVEAVMPFSPEKLSRWLNRQPVRSDLRPAIVEVKTRGGLGLNTDALQRQFTRQAKQSCTVLIYPVHGKKMVVVAHRPVIRQLPD